MTTVSYITVNQIASKITQLGPGTLMAKADIKEAYRIVPIHSDDKWDDELFIDLALPFSLQSAPLIFTALADGLLWILQQRGIHYNVHTTLHQ